MTLQGELGGLARHTAAVVEHPNSIFSAGLDLDRYVSCPRIERVFDQLFDHRGGSLNNLASGDLIDENIGQHLDIPSHTPGNTMSQ